MLALYHLTNKIGYYNPLFKVKKSRYGKVKYFFKNIPDFNICPSSDLNEKCPT